MSKPTLKITDNTADFMKVIQQFKNDEVLVGVPASNNSRDGGEIGNAAIAFINNFGSPANNIPPRPFMEIGIFNAQDAIAAEFKKCAQVALNKGLTSLTLYYERVGMIASNSVKRVITSQEGLESPAAKTIEARERNGNMSKKALLVTGSLRNSITYVVKGKNG